MLMLPSMQAVLHTAEQPSPSVLQLLFSEDVFNTRLRFSEGRLTGIRSDILPDWSTTLLHAGVNADAIAQAQLGSRKAEDVLGALLDNGNLEPDHLAALTRERTLGALLPLVWRTGLAQISAVAAHPALPLTSADVGQSVSAAEQHAGKLGGAEQNLRTTDQFLASPLAPSWSLDSEEARTVYQAALHGLSLGEMARRHALRWDVLARTVTRLVGVSALRPAGEKASERTGAGLTGDRRTAAGRTVFGRLNVGEAAPDFCLPDFSGGELRLSELRGQKIWLVFNRQSTCALCNPHHQQIIALSERMRSQGVRIVSVWGSTVADLALGIGKLRPPYPVLADPRDETYDRYGLGRSLRGFLDPRNMATAVEGLKMMGLGALKDDGELTRMPAEFLIGENGTIEVAHYNSYGVDWLPVERVLDWAGRP